MAPILELVNVQGGYRAGSSILRGVDLSIEADQVVAIIGRNGAGKSTLVQAIMRCLPWTTGQFLWKGREIGRLATEEIVSLGIRCFFQKGRTFPHLTIQDNLSMAGLGLDAGIRSSRLAELKTLIPFLSGITPAGMKREACFLSGGERCQLALAMVLMKKPKFLILDEPSAGLSPSNTSAVFEILKKIREVDRISMLLIEQNAKLAVFNSDRILLLEAGSVVKNQASKNLHSDEALGDFFFGNR